MTRIPVNSELLTWAREWEAGILQPRLRQLEDFARAVHVVVGFLFLPPPPDEPLPIPDF